MKAFEELLETKESYSKGDILQYGELNMRAYLKSKKLNATQGKVLFQIRTRMLQVKNNFKNGETVTLCPCCYLHIDDQEHMMTSCLKMENKITKKEYECIFGIDEDPMINVIKSIENIIMERKELLDILEEIVTLSCYHCEHKPKLI